MLIKRYLVIFAPIILGVILEGFILFPKLIYISVVFGFLFLIGVLIYMIKEGVLTREFWYIAMPPLFLIFSIVLIILFFEKAFVRHVFNWGGVLLLILYLENIFLYYYLPEKYQAYSLENISKTFNFISTFLFVSGLYGFSILVGLPLWVISAILILWAYLVSQQIFWVSNASRDVSSFYSIIVTIIIFEFFWILSFLPIDLYVSGLVMALVLYALTELTKDKILDKDINIKLLVWVGSVAAITLAVAVIFSFI